MNSIPPPAPLPVRFQGSRLARGLLRLGGWKVRFEGLPALQGVMVVYPHTSNWDFIVMILTKWAIGIPAHFWGKAELFRIPLFGRWLRWVGGVPIDRSGNSGAIGQILGVFEQHRQSGRLFWLGLSPEGTRKRGPGWRSGFYRMALGAGVPLGLVRLDYGRREVRASDFIELSGDEAADMERIVQAYQGVRGLRPELAAPIRLQDTGARRIDTIGG